MTKVSCILVAAGRGTRANSKIPKQYALLREIPVITRAISSILQENRISEVIPVIHADDAELYAKATQAIEDARLREPVIGGRSRTESVKNGLERVKGPVTIVHDAARPLLPLGALSRLLDAIDVSDAAFLALPVTDALWRGEEKAEISVERQNLWRAQTPQAFKTELLRKAYANSEEAADDVAMVHNVGIEATPILGSEENFKITHPEDFARAEAMLGNAMDIRVGTGFDVHAFEAGDHVILNGIRIPHAQSLKGHSDADVAMHAITDALYGALADGDIGQHFPPSETKWKNAASDIFLRHAAELVATRGYSISHIDCTIICEMPKIGPHAVAMRENLASITGISADRISVKATTSEQLGFTGRGEGIAAQATATLVTK